MPTGIAPISLAARSSSTHSAPVAHQDRQPLARPQAERDQIPRQPPHARAQPGEIVALAIIPEQREAGAILRRTLIEQRADGAGLRGAGHTAPGHSRMRPTGAARSTIRCASAA